MAKKQRIVEESLSGHRQASVTARRYGIPNSFLLRWRKAYAGCVGSAGLARFVPTVIVPVRVATARESCVGGGGRMEVASASSRRGWSTRTSTPERCAFCWPFWSSHYPGIERGSSVAGDRPH